METPPKRVISFYLDEGTMNKLDAMAIPARRNRSSQIAFLIDEAFEKFKAETETEPTYKPIAE